MPNGITPRPPSLGLLERRQLLRLAQQTSSSPLLWPPSLVISHAYKLQHEPDRTVADLAQADCQDLQLRYSQT
jgi:hypothetical protein